MRARSRPSVLGVLTSPAPGLLLQDLGHDQAWDFTLRRGARGGRPSRQRAPRPGAPRLAGPPQPPPRPVLQLQLQKSQYLQLGPSRGQYYGGSLPNVNQIGSGAADLPFQVSPGDPAHAHAPPTPP